MKPKITNNTLVIRIVTTFITLVLFFACSNPKTSPENNLQDQKESATIPVINKKPPSSFSDTIIITGKSAVFYNADSFQLEKIKAITEKMVYESNIHDCFYQMRNARIILKKYWPKLQIIETSKARYLLFCRLDNSKICIDLDTKSDMCGIFLFDGKKEPELADMMNIDTALRFYFSE